jgi:hypothetical protein
MKRVYCFLVGLIFSGCINNLNTAANFHYDKLDIKIISPFGCLQEITLMKSGHGKFLQGLPAESIRSESFVFDTLFSTYNFLISDTRSHDSIGSFVSGIMQQRISRGFRSDSYRIMVIVNDQKYYDVYGHTELTHKMVAFFDKFLIDQRKYCEYFSTFHPQD